MKSRCRIFRNGEFIRKLTVNRDEGFGACVTSRIHRANILHHSRMRDTMTCPMQVCVSLTWRMYKLTGIRTMSYLSHNFCEVFESLQILSKSHPPDIKFRIPDFEPTNSNLPLAADIMRVAMIWLAAAFAAIAFAAPIQKSMSYRDQDCMYQTFL